MRWKYELASLAFVAGVLALFTVIAMYQYGAVRPLDISKDIPPKCITGPTHWEVAEAILRRNGGRLEDQFETDDYLEARSH